MSASADKAQITWLPLTLRGVAAFARASLERLLLVQLIVALLTAGAVVWFLHNCWFPTIGEAIRALPAQGELRSGKLDWTGASPASLAEGRFLAISVDLEHTGQARSPAHVQVEFGRVDFRVYSLFGCGQGAYPPGGALAFNRTVLWPWWGAWAPAILAIVVGAVVAGLMSIWAVLATLYCLPVWLIGFFANRECSLSGSWRLAGAALMPGALLMGTAICMYGLNILDPLRLAMIGGVHLVMGWVYLFLSPLCLPRYIAVAPEGNPFA
jgi:hypothetical protein